MNDTVEKYGPDGHPPARDVCPTRPRRRLRVVAVTTAVGLAGALVVGLSGPSGATVTTVSGSATGYLLSVGLFGGPASQRGPAGTPGCDPNLPPPGPNSTRTEGCSPTVSLPSSGSASPITATDADGVRAVYGPAVIFGGRWSWSISAPPSGPISVSTQGTTGPYGSVASSVSITRAPSGATWLPPGEKGSIWWPGGVGPGPVVADGVTSGCRAVETNASTGSSTVFGWTAINNGRLGLSTDQWGDPVTIEPMPASPRPNDGPHRGVLTNVGDSFEVFYNEQDTSVPGSITVTAIHMRLLGPIAVGDLYIGRTQCSVRGGGGGSTTTMATTAPMSCAELQASLARMNAAVDAAEASIPFTVPRELQAAALADLERIRAQRTAEIKQAMGSACPSVP